MKKIAISNIKGGVGKTTLTVNLAAALAEQGKKPLILDLDPQASVTAYFDLEPTKTVYDVMKGTASVAEVICTKIKDINESIGLIPSSVDLFNLILDGDLDVLEVIRQIDQLTEFDVLLIDTPGGLGDLLYDSLRVSDFVLIPIQPETLAIKAWDAMSRVIFLAKKENKNLRTLGIVPFMYGEHLAGQKFVFEQFKTKLNGKVSILRTVIPRSVAISDAAILNVDVLTYEGKSKGARSAEKFRCLALEVLPSI